MTERSAGVDSEGFSGSIHSSARMQTAILFSLMFAVQFAVAALMPLGAEEFGDVAGPLWLVMFGAAFSQPALLALWAVFGPQRAAVRLPLTLWVAAAGFLCIAFAVNQNAGERNPEALLTGGVWFAAFGVFQPPLWLIRAVRHWRLKRPESAATSQNVAETAVRSAPKPTSQFSLRALLGWICAAALLLGGFRALAPQTFLGREELFATSLEAGFVSLLAALGALPVIALAWIVLADGRRLALRVILSALVLIGLATACNLFGPANDLIDAYVLLLAEAGVLLNGLISFGAVRACGYRLRRPAKTLTSTAELNSPAPISRVRFAFTLAPLAVGAVGLAASVPIRLEQWRRAELRVDWRQVNLEPSFSADGTINGLNYIQPTQITDDLCQRVASVETLQDLSLAGSAIDDRQLGLLAPLARLESLDLTGATVTDRGLKKLSQFPELAKLDLANTPITDAGLANLTELQALRELTLSLTEISNGGLSALAPLSALKHVDAVLTAVTADGAVEFRQSHPQASVDFGASDALLRRSPKMHREYIMERTVLGYGMCSQRIKLKLLHARGKVVAGGVAAGVTDAGLAVVAAHTELEELDLRESNVTDKGVMTLRALTNLKRLDLRGSAVTGQGVQNLARVLPDCEILR